MPATTIAHPERRPRPGIIQADAAADQEGPVTRRDTMRAMITMQEPQRALNRE